MLYPLNDVVNSSTQHGYGRRGPTHLYSERLGAHETEILDDRYERHIKRCETWRYSI